MSNSDFTIPESFDGTVRLFPLPNMVLFPGVIQALNLFEPRYRQLIGDAIEDDQLITMALVKPGEENRSLPVPEIYQTVCVGKIMTHAQLENGTYNVLLAGVARAVIVEEFSSDTLYRQARVELLPEEDFIEDESKGFRARLIDLFKSSREIESQFDEQALDKLISDRIEVGQLADLIAYAANISPSDQQGVLETTDVRKRVEFLIEKLTELNERVVSPEITREFPPGFSLN